MELDLGAGFTASLDGPQRRILICDGYIYKCHSYLGFHRKHGHFYMIDCTEPQLIGLFLKKQSDKYLITRAIDRITCFSS